MAEMEAVFMEYERTLVATHGRDLATAWTLSRRPA
jgi:hypothetical protein